MKKTPQITVLMPVFNVALYVKEAIESILNQTFGDFELLIINDGSTDSTREEVLKINDERIRFIENERNLGLANTLNKGIELAKGKYIARMDGDDISSPQRLEKQYRFLEEHPDIDICGANYRFFGDKNYKVIYPEFHEDIKVGLLFGCCMIIPMMRKESINKYNLRYKQEFFPAEDYKFWTECVMNLKMYNIQEELFHYRTHPTQVCATMTNQPEMTTHVREIYLESVLPELSDNDKKTLKKYFLTSNNYVNEEEIETLIRWIKKFQNKKEIFGNLDFHSFNRQLKSILNSRIELFSLNKWFKYKYSLIGYFSFFRSKHYLYTSNKFKIKTFLKSVLSKKMK